MRRPGFGERGWRRSVDIVLASLLVARVLVVVGDALSGPSTTPWSTSATDSLSHPLIARRPDPWR